MYALSSHCLCCAHGVTNVTGYCISITRVGWSPRSARHGGPLHTDTAPRSEHSARQRAADILTAQVLLVHNTKLELSREAVPTQTTYPPFLLRQLHWRLFLPAGSIGPIICFAVLNHYLHTLYVSPGAFSHVSVPCCCPIECMCDNTSVRIAWK